MMKRFNFKLHTEEKERIEERKGKQKTIQNKRKQCKSCYSGHGDGDSDNGIEKDALYFNSDKFRTFHF